MESTRRVFLESLGLAAGSAVLGSGLVPRRAAAAERVERNFVFAYFSGGWDTLLSLDPRDPSVFTEARIGETKIQLGWDRLAATYPRTIIQPSGSNIAFGPVMGGLAEHFDKLCMVRGMSMDTVTHEVGRRYFITGMTPRGLNAAGSSMGTRIVAAQGDSTPIPSLVSRVETYNENDPTFASGLSVNGSSDLLLALQDGPSAPRDAVRRRLDEHRARVRLCDPAGLDKRGLLSLIKTTQSKARDLVGSNLSRLFNFAADDAEITVQRTRYGITNPNLVTAGSQAAIAFQAIKHAVAQTVTIEIAGGLDTHGDEWATDQPDNLAEGFTALGRLVSDLAAEVHPDGGTLLDHTTIVAFSEFGRTALINNRDGRDHSLSSSALLIGAGVPHNRVIGRSSDVGLNPMGIDPITGEPDSAGVIVNPNNLLASVMRSAGFDTDRLRSDGLPCLIA